MIILIVNISKNTLDIKFLTYLFILSVSLILLSYVTRNYGIAFRQRVIMLPFLLTLINICPINLKLINSKL